MSAQQEQGLLASAVDARRGDVGSEETLEALLSTLASVKDSDVPEAIKGLTAEQTEGLMRDIYRGLSRGDAALSARLFRWHAQLVGALGLGAIMRSLQRQVEQ